MIRAREFPRLYVSSSQYQPLSQPPHPSLPSMSSSVPLSRVMVPYSSMLVTYRPLRIAAYSSGVLLWLRVISLAVMSCSPPFVLLVLVACSFVAAVLRARCCAPAHGECEAGAVCAGSVVSARRGEGELRLVAVYHDEDCVRFVAVMVVVVLRIFDVGVHDAGGVVASLVGVFEVIPAVHASHAAFVAFNGERVAVVEGEGGGAYFVVANGDACYVAASENFRVFFRRAVLVGDSVVVQVVGGVHVLYCSTHTPRVSTCVDALVGWLVGWLVGCSPRGSVVVCL